MFIVCHHDRGSAVAHDVGNFVTVESCIDWNGDEPRMPCSEHCFEIFGSVAHHDGNASSCFELVGLVKSRCNRRNGCCKLRPRRMNRLAESDGRRVRPKRRVPVNPRCKVHSRSVSICIMRDILPDNRLVKIRA
jgi:hypothetical protein